MPKTPPIPENEELRLGELEKYRVMDTEIEEDFDRITRFAAEFFDVPIALVSLVDEKRQWFKSKIGLDVSETPREIAFCTYAICSPEPLVVNDALEDNRFKESPLVLGDPNIRFYAGAPLTTNDGQNLGTLCVIDRVPRTLTRQQERFLQDLAKIVINQLELRLAKLRAEEDLQRGIESVQILRNSQTRLNAFFNSTLDAMLVLDAEGRIESHNTAAEKLFGYNSTELNQMFAKVLMPDSFDKEAEKYFRNYKKSGTDKIFLSYSENIFGHKSNGDSFPMELSLSEMLINNKRHYTVVVRDISDQRRSEKALLHALSTTEQTKNAMTELLDRVGHELRTPLNAILGFTEILESEMQSKMTLTQQEYFTQVIKGGKQLASLINEILAIRASRSDSQITQIDLGNFIIESWKLAEREAQRNKLAFRTNVHDFTDFVVETRLEDLRQVLSHLLSNAIKFNTIGGSVEVRISKVGNHAFRISVSNDGPSIHIDDQSRIFDVFKRLDEHKYKVEGMGIGLAICKSIIENMNGRIWVDSAEGEGSTFYIEAPLRCNQEKSVYVGLDEDADVSVESSEVGSAVLLLISSNAGELNLLETVVEGLSKVTLLTAMRGPLGFAQAIQHQPDLIILDSELPDHDGDTILKELRSNIKTADIPIVLLCCGDSAELEIKHATYSRTEMWVKPLKETSVARALAKYLGG